MIVSRGRRYLFAHIPKTGGTALSLALEARAMADDILIGDTPKARQRSGRLKGLKTAGRLWKHSTLADIDGLLTPQELDEMFLFTLVRNPWDRMVSYYHWAREQDFEHPAIAFAKRMSFCEFARHGFILKSFRINPYTSFFRDARGRQHQAHYFRLEDLPGALAPLEAHLGFAIDMPRANASRRDPDYRRYYDDATAEAVGAACAEDIARFCYTF